MHVACTGNCNVTYHVVGSDAHRQCTSQTNRSSSVEPQIVPTSNKIRLTSNIGSTEVVDGDLSDPYARAHLANGMCGDLAAAIQDITGGSAYIISHHYVDEDELLNEIENDLESVYLYATHIVVESSTKPLHFVDSYGQQDYESLEDHFQTCSMVELPGNVLSRLVSKQDRQRLHNFAVAALKLDEQETQYEYEDVDEW